MRHSVFVTFGFSSNVIPSIAALVSVLPELVAESDPREALKQVPLFLHLYVYALVKKKMILGLFYKANCVFTLLERWAASSLVLPSWVASRSYEQESLSPVDHVFFGSKLSCELKPVPTLTVIIVLMALLNKLKALMVRKGKKRT